MKALEVLSRPKVRKGGGWALAIGGALILAYFLAGALFPVPKVGIIEIQGRITTSSLDEITSWLDFAREERGVEAVVLVIDSPGGGASSSQEIFYQVLTLKEQKPVVASINQLGASGAYHIAVASNFIYAKPASLIGSIGVRARLPSPDRPTEDIIITGPFKDPGSSRSSFVGTVQLLQEDFLETVISQRGDNLRLGKEELTQGEIYLGLVALEHGLIDALGSRADAIEKAADYAGLIRYEVVSIERAWEEGRSPASPTSERQLGASTSETPPWPIFDLLYTGAVR